MCVDLANDEISKKKLQNHHFPYMYANSEQQFCLLGLKRTVADLNIICPKIRMDFALGAIHKRRLFRGGGRRGQKSPILLSKKPTKGEGRGS